MSDDEIWLLNRGGHDQQKVYAAYHAAVSHTGQPDGDPGQDDQGLRHGRSRRGADHHPPGQEDGRGRPARFRDRFDLPLTDEQVARGRVLHAPRRLPRDAVTCASAAPRSAATCRLAAARPQPLAVPPLRDVRRAAREHRRPRDLDHDGLRADPRHAVARQADRPPVVPIVPDESRTFGMEGLFRQVGIYSPVGQLYQPAGLRPADVLQGGPARADPARRASPRPASISSFIAAGTSYSAHDVPDAAVLHLLLDVRLSSGSATSSGPPPTAAPAASCSAAPPGARRSTARACSTRTATATCCSRSCRTSAPTTRRSPTSWRSSSRTGCAACSASRRTSSTTSP